jgi:hypothetical protein
MVPTLYPFNLNKSTVFQATPALAAQVQFNRATSGKVLGLQWNQYGGVYELTRAGDVDLPPELAVSRSAAGLELELIGDTGKTYVIEASADLRTWLPVSTNTMSDVLIKLSPAEPLRFYRACE